MEIWTALIAGVAAFVGSWIAPFSKDRALANEEARAHNRKLLSDAREAIQWFSGFDANKSFIYDAKYLAIRPYLKDEQVLKIESPFLSGVRMVKHLNREWGSPSLDVFRAAVDDLEKRWFRK